MLGFIDYLKAAVRSEKTVEYMETVVSSRLRTFLDISPATRFLTGRDELGNARQRVIGA